MVSAYSPIFFENTQKFVSKREKNEFLIVHKNSPYQFLPHQCMSCRKKSTLICSRCELAYYCNAECQKKDSVLHKELCNITIKNLCFVDEDVQKNYGNLSDDYRCFQRLQVFTDVLSNGKPITLSIEIAAVYNDVAMCRFFLYCGVLPRNIVKCYKPTIKPLQFEIIEQIESCVGACNCLGYGDLLMYSCCEYDNDEIGQHFKDVVKYLTTHEINDTNDNFYLAIWRLFRRTSTYDRGLKFLSYFAETGYITCPPNIILSLSKEVHATMLSWKTQFYKCTAKRKRVLQNELALICIPELVGIVVSYLKV